MTNIKDIISEYDQFYMIKEYEGKLVIVFDRHHYALPVWGVYSNSVEQTCELITFDSHCDTLPCFNVHLKKITFEAEQKIERHNILKDKNYKRSFFNFADVFGLTYNYIRHDEHIKAAYDWEYITKYTVITNDSEYYDKQTNDIAESYSCLYIPKSNWSKILNCTSSQSRLILDFDLDYFTSKDDLTGFTCQKLTDLIKRSGIITIAREPSYFEKCKQDTTDIAFTNDYALASLLDIIEKALNN